MNKSFVLCSIHTRSGFIFSLLVCACFAPTAWSQPSNTLSNRAWGTAAEESSQPPSSGGGFFSAWFDMVTETQSKQPHWITPVVTVTPRLEQEYRYDIFWQPNAEGIVTENYGGSKGLEIIPWKTVEVIFIQPPYLVHSDSKLQDGWGDFQILGKYRIIARNEENGNYILTAFFQVSFPTGQFKNGSTNHIITPTIAYGKGYRRFSLQGTFGMTLPTGNSNVIGRTYPWNNAFQYHLGRLWPEIEVNYTYFQKGPNDGKTQVFLTPGIVIGRFPIHKRVAFVFGGGFQIATTHFHTNNHNGILTLRLPF